MVNRYGYKWEYLTTSGGGEDENGDPIAATEVWTEFECDVQTSSGRFVTGDTGDNIPVTYSLFTKVNTGVVKGGKVRDEKMKEYTVLQIHNYNLNYEIWV